MLNVLPCAAEPARHPQELESLSLEQLGNIQVTTVSKQPEEMWHTPAEIYESTGDNGDAAGIRRRLFAGLTWRP